MQSYDSMVPKPKHVSQTTLNNTSAREADQNGTNVLKRFTGKGQNLGQPGNKGFAQ